MKFKKLLLFTIVLLCSFLFTNKTKAVDISYCNYGSITLTIPFTVQVEVTGINSNYPFDNNKNYYYTNSLYVYNRATCESAIPTPFIQSQNGLNIIKEGYNTYYVSSSYYYIYNGNSYISDTSLIYGKYSEIDTTPPLISSSSEIIKVNMNSLMSTDEILSYIRVTDQTDSNIRLEIIDDTYTPNYNIPGSYIITFEACDKSHNCSKFYQTIKVIDYTPPTIDGISEVTSYMSNPLTMLQLKNMLTAHDNYDGDISSFIELLETDFNKSAPGIYYAYFSVCDNSNNKIAIPHKIKITFIDDIAPTIEGPTHFTSFLSSKLSLNEILSHLVVTDNYDIHAHKNMYVVNSTYNETIATKGEYKVIVSSYDNSGNDSLPYIITINVKDDISPSITGLSTYISYLSNPISIISIKNKLIAMDNCDGNINHKIDIYNDEYSLNMSSLGVYNVSFIAKDSSENISNIFNVEITTIDDVNPLIEGVNNYTLLTSEKISLDTLKNSLRALDNVDGDISYKIELDLDLYSDNYNIPGTYFLNYYVCDKSGNISIPFKVKITVNQNISYLQSINNSSLYLDTANAFNEFEILSLMNINREEYQSINIIENTYKNNFDIIGNYKILYELENFDYTKDYLTINIKTYLSTNKQTETNNKENKKKETLFSYIVSFFKSLFINLSIDISKLFI